MIHLRSGWLKMLISPLNSGRLKNPNQLSIGFALETHDELLHAKRKLDKKQFDMVVLNSMNDENACFGYDSNKIHIIKRILPGNHFR